MVLWCCAVDDEVGHETCFVAATFVLILRDEHAVQLIDERWSSIDVACLPLPLLLPPPPPPLLLLRPCTASPRTPLVAPQDCGMQC